MLGDSGVVEGINFELVLFVLFILYSLQLEYGRAYDNPATSGQASKIVELTPAAHGPL
jgi:hypothetical protein